MKQLNYNHLHYFYLIAKEGSIASASKRLHLTPQTLSGQLSTLESYLGRRLFDRHGKRLLLNDQGKKVYAYADDIFSLGNELLQSLEPDHQHQKLTFAVGVTDVLPKALIYEVLKPAFEQDFAIKMICREGRLKQLLADLALNKIDVILSDSPIPVGHKVKAYSFKAIDSGISFYVANNQLTSLKGDFPQNLQHQKLLIPGAQSSLKNALLSWLDDKQLSPNIIAEFDDSALINIFGQAGFGIFCTPTLVEQYIVNSYPVTVIGRTEEIGEQLYIISNKRKVTHPALAAIKQQFYQNDHPSS
ncbi:transcriptional activator NhaR [Thalassotalea maritima]|uniref:transcriptional activator NhaR n=1 Tax=Thalassotalea maritima TaxID=3242416 RepID=UPI003527F094